MMTGAAGACTCAAILNRYVFDLTAASEQKMRHRELSGDGTTALTALRGGLDEQDREDRCTVSESLGVKDDYMYSSIS